MAPKCTLIFYMSSFGFSKMSIQDPEPDKEYIKLYQKNAFVAVLNILLVFAINKDFEKSTHVKNSIV